MNLNLAAQSIYGKVTDKNSGEPLIGAVVFVSDQYNINTDVQGEYSLDLPSGTYNISVSFVGYKTLIEKNIALQSDSKKELNFMLEENNELLQTAVISAGKFEQKIEELTVSMEVLKPDLIESKNTTTVEDALQQAPGMVIVDSEPQIRSGSGYSFGAGSRVMIMVDDLPLVSGDAGRPSWGFFAVENIEQIEIIKGASSVLYGSGALNGVVNVRTAFPREKPKTKVTVFHGVFSDPQTAEAKYWDRSQLQSGINALHSRQIGNLDFTIGASVLIDESFKGPYLDSTSRYAPFDPLRADATHRARANVNLRYRSKKVSGLSYGVNTNWLIGSTVATLLWENSTDGLYAPFNNSATRTDQIVGNLDPFISYVTSNGVSHSIKTRWHNLDNDNDTRSAANPEGGANQDNFSDFYYSEYQYQRNFDSLGIKNFNLTAGVMSMFTFSEAQLYAGLNPDGINDARNIAAYLQLDKKIKNRLNLSGGVRFENFKINDQEESRPVFRSGLNYKVAEATFLRASWGQGFRFPTIAEKFISTSVGGITVYPSLDLQPESSTNLEFGLKQGFKIGKFLGYADVAVFRQDYENFIEFTFGKWAETQGSIFDPDFDTGLGFRSLNTGGARVTGIETSVMGQGKIGQTKFTLLAGYTFTNPISTTPDLIYAEQFPGGSFIASYNESSSNPSEQILKYRFKHLFRLDLEAKYQKFTAGLSTRYNSRTENIDRAFLQLEDIGVLTTGLSEWLATRNNGNVVLDFRTSYQISKKIKGALVVSNLLNEEYALRPLSIEAPRLTTFQFSYAL